MSCCISSAVCCVLITSSMSGVALGYNYSLAEYIDTKETNVSVYIKRGVFDDDVINDMVDWRRQGHQSMKGFVEDNNLKTANEEVGPDQMPESSGRRLDNSIIESNDNNNFEGSLMKLTLKPPHLSTTPASLTDDSAMLNVMTSYAPDSLDQLKAIQGIINARKAGAARNPMDKENGEATRGDINPYMPGTPPGPGQPDQFRRMMAVLSGPGYQRPELARNNRNDGTQLPQINPARFAVPSGLTQENWEAPKMSPELYRRIYSVEDIAEGPPKMPKPVTYMSGPMRPTTTKRYPEYGPWQISKVVPQKVTPAAPPSTEKNVGDQNIMDEKSASEERFDERSGSEDVEKKDFLEKLPGPKIVGQETNEYYDEELKGLPVRRRRSINNSKSKLPRKVEQAIPQKVIPGHLMKFKVGKSISNEFIAYPSVLVSKLHFPDNLVSNETTSTNEMEVTNSTKTVGQTVDNSHPIIDSTIGKVLKIIQSMFS